MKTIGIDARLYSQTGVGTYLRNLLVELEDLVNEYEINVYLIGQDFEKVTFKNSHFHRKLADYHWHSLGEQFGFYYQLRQDSPDLMHFTYFGYPILYRKPFIATVHDVTPLIYKTGKASTRNPLVYEFKYQIFKQVLARQVANATSLIVPSKYVKDELGRMYGQKIAKKTKVIYEGVNRELLTAIEKTGQANRLDGPFFIYVGNFYPHKNIGRLIRAFQSVPPPYRLILIGPEDTFAAGLKKIINESGQDQRILFRHNVDVGDLLYFYKHALALIHPSISEGFGLPLVDAAHFGLPIIASDIPVFRELLGDRYVPFDPQSHESIVSAIKLFLAQEKKYTALPADETFSFKRMAKETLEVYKKAI